MGKWQRPVEAVDGLTTRPPEPGGYWLDKRVLVTGATGIVGSWVCRALLAAGSFVVTLIRDSDYRSELYRSGAFRHVATTNGSLDDFWTVERTVNEHEVDTVFHLGAQTIVGTAERFPLQTFEANVRGTYHVLEACRLHASLVRRIVVASSDKAYGDHQGRPYDEQAPLEANHPYDVSKACGDLLAQTYAHTYGLPVTIARCGNIYGGGDLNWSRIIPGSIRSLHNGERPVLRSDGTYVRDYLYVKDAASAYLALGQACDDRSVHGQAFNFSGESPRTVLALVQELAALMGQPGLQPVILNTARNEIPQQVLCSRKARTVLGWSPRFDLERGLTETIAWYREYLNEEVAASLT